MATTKQRAFERLLLQFLGPADVLDPDTPPHPFVVREDICAGCGRPRSTHRVTRDPVLGSVSECPGPGTM